mgnify:CR=1 FL=1
MCSLPTPLLQHLNVQVEAALAQGLSFKDKFRTSDRRRERSSEAGDGSEEEEDEEERRANRSEDAGGSGSAGQADGARTGGGGAWDCLQGWCRLWGGGIYGSMRKVSSLYARAVQAPINC